MHRRFATVASLVLALFAGAALAEEARSPAATLRTLAAQDDQVMAHLDHLVNRIGPRLTGSSNIEKAYEWTRARFESFGLANARTETWGEWPIGFDRAGPTTGKLVGELGEKTLECGSWAWTAGTDGPRRGRAVWEPRTKEELAAAKDDLRGAWVVVRAGRGAGRIVSREERAAVRKGVDAAGIAGRVHSSGGHLILTDGNPRGITMDKLPKVPSVIVTLAGHREIAKLLDARKPCELEFDVKNVFFQGPVQNKNVIADLVGSERPDEYVIVGGHLDSWDGATGTCDNGTGVATTLEAARLLARLGVRPRRTIRFVLWSGEEQGLFGSAGYVKAHASELARTSAVLVHDGGTNYVAGMPATPAMMKVLGPALAHLATWDRQMPFKLREVKHLPLGIGSDHDTFLGKGVPGFFWDQKGRHDYDHVHHTQFDTFDAAIPEYQRHSAVTIAAAALAIADLDQLLPRDGMLAPRPQRKMLGVQTSEDLTIQSVVEESLAEAAGLEEGDRITAIGGKPVTNLQELRDAIRAAEGETEVRFVRDGEEQKVTVSFATAAPAKKRRWL